MLVTCPSNIEEARLLAPYSSYFLVGIKDYIPNFLNPLSLAEFRQLANENIKLILRLDMLVREREIVKYQELIDNLKELDILYYITDQGLLNYLIDLKLANRVIYDPFTMLTNYLDAKTYYDLGLNAIAPSLEIPYKDILKFQVPLFYPGFTRRLMFNSKRNLVSLYKEKAHLSFDIHDNLTLIEEKRVDILPIFEDKGTFIYRPYYLDNMPLIKGNRNIKYLLIDAVTIEFIKYLPLVKLAYAYFNEEITLEIYKEELNKLDFKIELGFTYEDTIYLKEAIIDAKN